LKVIENKTYNQLIEQLVDYREIKRREELAQQAQQQEQEQEKGEGEEFHGFILKRKSSSTSPTTTKYRSSSSSFSSSSPSKQTVEQMMKERQLIHTDAMKKAIQLLEEGPILDHFFHTTASQLTYYGLVKLHEELKERQLCVFFRNNHFSTMFKVSFSVF
jgi:hypothetical protein